MKFRVRFGKEKFVVVIDNENSTVENLKEAICRETSVRNVSSVQVSLNGVDVIEENDRNLSSLGLVSGDLIHVLSPNQNEIGMQSSTPDPKNIMLSEMIEMGFDQELAEHALSQVSYTSLEKAVDIITNNEVKNVETLHQEPVSLSGDKSSDISSIAGPSNRSGSTHYIPDNTCNPVFCRDGVSDVLEMLYNTAAVKTHHHAMFVLVHALMMESGFFLKYEGEGHEASEGLPVGWNSTNIVKLLYHHNLSVSVTCQLVLTSLGPFVYAHVWSVEAESNAYEVKLVVSHYIKGDVPLASGAKSVYKNLHKVSRCVKNNLVHPLLANIQAYVGVMSPFSLIGLPPEIQLMILSQLSAASLVTLSATCKNFNVICNDEKLWQFFCQRDFGKESNTVDSWKKQYKILYKRRKQLERDRSETTTSFFPEFPFAIPEFNPFLPRVPHILGGPRDLVPDFLIGQPPRDETSLRIFHPDNRSRSDLRLRPGAGAIRGTFFA